MNKVFSFVLLLATGCTGIHYKHFDNGFYAKVGDVPASTRIFLVAGGYPTANFAQEVADQMEFWQAQGYSRDQIACYWIPPASTVPLDDRSGEKQYRKLQSVMENCYMAQAKELLRHIASLEKENPSSIYIYISGHGSRPLREWHPKGESHKTVKQWRQIRKIEPWVDSFTLQMAATRDEVVDVFQYVDAIDAALLYAEKYPTRADDYLLTPRGFANALRHLPSSTKKYIVLQGCFSGGFILPTAQVGAANTLREVQNVTVLTAASADRTSFGCGPGTHTTYFGEAYFRALNDQGARKFDALNWPRLQKTAEVNVRAIESASAIGADQSSQPQYFSNIP